MTGGALTEHRDHFNVLDKHTMGIFFVLHGYVYTLPSGMAFMSANDIITHNHSQFDRPRGFGMHGYPAVLKFSLLSVSGPPPGTFGLHRRAGTATVSCGRKFSPGRSDTLITPLAASGPAPSECP